MFGKISSQFAEKSFALVRKSIHILNFFLIFKLLACKENFLNITHFQHHFNSHSIIPQSQCVKCKETINKETIMRHLKECHAFGNYNCAFCVYGTDVIEDLKIHLANDHANKILFFFDRSLQNLQEVNYVTI